MALYVPNATKTYISLDAIFDENFTSPLSMPDLPFQGALILRIINMQITNTETLTEVTGPPIGENDTYLKDIIKEHLTPEITIEKDSQPSHSHERGTLRKGTMTRSFYKEN